MSPLRSCLSILATAPWLLCAAPAVQAAPPAAKADARPAAAAAESDPLQTLRERLAQRLGTMPAPERPGARAVRASTRSASDEPARAATPRKRAAEAGHEAQAAAVPHWSYSGETGPRAWGGLRPEFSLCGNGQRQSPIDIRAGFAVDLEPISFDYRASPFRVIDNGHTLQVNFDAGNAVVIRGERYELVQFHFHHPAEERIDGRSFDMSLHLVHRSAEGKLAVVALLLERGDVVQPVVQTVWNNLPLEKNDEVSTRAVIDLNHLLPPDRGYYTYMGSLTTPPCTEGVLWAVMRQPVTVSAAQIALFARIYPMNARPVQSAAGRTIKQSN